MTTYIQLNGKRTAIQYRVYHLTDGKIPFLFHEIKCRGQTFRGDDLVGVVHAVRDVFDDYSQQPEVLACQGGGEMFKTCSSNPTRADEVGNLSRNPSADAIFRMQSVHDDPRGVWEEPTR